MAWSTTRHGSLLCLCLVDKAQATVVCSLRAHVHLHCFPLCCMQVMRMLEAVDRAFITHGLQTFYEVRVLLLPCLVVPVPAFFAVRVRLLAWPCTCSLQTHASCQAGAHVSCAGVLCVLCCACRTPCRMCRWLGRLATTPAACSPGWTRSATCP